MKRRLDDNGAWVTRHKVLAIRVGATEYVRARGLHLRTPKEALEAARSYSVWATLKERI